MDSKKKTLGEKMTEVLRDAFTTEEERYAICNTKFTNEEIACAKSAAFCLLVKIQKEENMDEEMVEGSFEEVLKRFMFKGGF